MIIIYLKKVASKRIEKWEKLIFKCSMYKLIFDNENILHLMVTTDDRYFSNDKEKCPDSVRFKGKDEFPNKNYCVNSDF